MVKQYVSNNPKKTVLLFIILSIYYFCLPRTLFTSGNATVIESANGSLLGAKIAKDGQWRFPSAGSVPEKFEKCILSFEDAYFYYHPGFNPVSIGKALYTNISNDKIKRGGSTITQQVIRLHRKGQKRTYGEKLVEVIQATRLEFRYSKEEILRLYASHAPFGGNVVGIEAASWRYFGRSASQLSWAESATLAVLPNAPSLIFPGKNQQRLLKKRNRLLRKMYQEKTIDSLTYSLSLQETLPQKPYPLPRLAPHLLDRLVASDRGKRIKTSIDITLQKQVQGIVSNYYLQNKDNHIYNAAVLVVDISSKKVQSYIGNTPTDKAHQKDVDIIDKPRSTGSVLKPFLYAAMLQQGALLPKELVPDIPTTIGSYQPQNFDKKYRGAVPADIALAKSLNVPAVRMLRSFGLDNFYHYLQELQLENINKGVDHYGLSLILGGAESNLWDLSRAYTNLASVLIDYDLSAGKYNANAYEDLLVKESSTKKEPSWISQPKLLDAGSIYLLFEAMKGVNRPEEMQQEFFSSYKEIAWKTGTSFGHRDAWAIGLTSNYLVAVWVGNADGEGRPNLTGITKAAPILMDVFDLLPKAKWFERPYDALRPKSTCSVSGYLAGPICEKTDTVWVSKRGLDANSCPYHKWVHVDAAKKYQVNASCVPLGEMQHESWFTLPPVMEFYYKKNNSNYSVLPPFRSDCIQSQSVGMDFIYPEKNAKIYLPTNEQGEKEKVLFEIVHSLPNTTVYWYLDKEYIGSTKGIHKISYMPRKGKHTLTIVDSNGVEIKRSFEIVE